MQLCVKECADAEQYETMVKMVVERLKVRVTRQGCLGVTC